MKETKNIWEFLSVEWFEPSILNGFEWGNPYYLYAIPFIPLLFIFRGLIYYKFKQKLDVALFESSSKFDPISLFRFIPLILQNIFIALIFVALARPQKVNEQVEQWTEGIDINLILDTSTSMEGLDFRPNRMEAVKRVANDFIAGRTQDRIGLVVFAGEAYSLSPLTTDYKLLQSLLEDVKMRMIPKDGTAIGDALAVGLNRMQDSKAKSKIVILLSDGNSNQGKIEPLTAAELAYGFGIKVYTIGVGKKGEVFYPATNMFGMATKMAQKNTFDETTLRKIAEKTGGQFFRATNGKALKEIFKIIDEFEKSEIKENRFKNTEDYYQIYLQWALLFFLLWMTTKITFMNNYLED